MCEGCSECDYDQALDVKAFIRAHPDAFAVDYDEEFHGTFEDMEAYGEWIRIDNGTNDGAVKVVPQPSSWLYGDFDYTACPFCVSTGPIVINTPAEDACANLLVDIAGADKRPQIEQLVRASKRQRIEPRDARTCLLGLLQ